VRAISLTSQSVIVGNGHIPDTVTVFRKQDHQIEQLRDATLTDKDTARKRFLSLVFLLYHDFFQSKFMVLANSRSRPWYKMYGLRQDNAWHHPVDEAFVLSNRKLRYNHTARSFLFIATNITSCYQI
jgi:hypothetical protein